MIHIDNYFCCRFIWLEPPLHSCIGTLHRYKKDSEAGKDRKHTGCNIAEDGRVGVWTQIKRQPKGIGIF
jgi:hypothetical protein